MHVQEHERALVIREEKHDLQLQVVIMHGCTCVCVSVRARARARVTGGEGM